MNLIVWRIAQVGIQNDIEKYGIQKISIENKRNICLFTHTTIIHLYRPLSRSLPSNPCFRNARSHQSLNGSNKSLLQNRPYYSYNKRLYIIICLFVVFFFFRARAPILYIRHLLAPIPGEMLRDLIVCKHVIAVNIVRAVLIYHHATIAVPLQYIVFAFV